MLDAVKKAQLSGREFARIIGVSFPAVCNWMAGRTKPHVLLQPKVENALELIGKLCDKDKLPLPESLTSQERREKIDKIGLLLSKYKA